MRKMSELLRISSQYHYAFNDRYTMTYMCGAAADALYFDKMTEAECNKVRDFCMEIVESVSETSAFLSRALRESDLPNDKNTIFLIYSAVIDKLESEGN